MYWYSHVIVAKAISWMAVDLGFEKQIIQELSWNKRKLPLSTTAPLKWAIARRTLPLELFSSLVSRPLRLGSENRKAEPNGEKTHETQILQLGVMTLWRLYELSVGNHENSGNKKRFLSLQNRTQWWKWCVPSAPVWSTSAAFLLHTQHTQPEAQRHRLGPATRYQLGLPLL